MQASQPEPLDANANRARRCLHALLLAGLLVRVVAACWSCGLMHPDEHQQYIEQSFRLLHGYGAIYWEQEYGIRHPLFSLLLAAFLWLGERAGITDPIWLAAAQRLMLSLASYAGLAYLAWSLYRRGRPVAGLVVAVLAACSVDLVFMQVRVMSENACVGVLALALAWWPRRPVRVGALLGLLIGLRLQTAPVALVLLACSAWMDWQAVARGRRRWTLPGLAVGLALSLLVMGWLDRTYQGSWFHSFRASVEKQWVEDAASAFGVRAWYAHLVNGTLALLRVSPAAIVLLFPGARRRWDLALVLIVFVVAHSLIPHKEGRFLWPMAPVVGLLIATGFEQLYQRPWCRRGLVVGCVVLSLVGASLVRACLMEWRNETYLASCRALARIGRQHDVRGVVLLGVPRWNAGNYFYLRQQVPIVYLRREEQQQLTSDPNWENGALNYIVAPRDSLNPALVARLTCVGTWRRWEVFRVCDRSPMAEAAAAGSPHR
jgi:hypothetical protein